MILGLVGKIGSGKDTCGDWLATQHKFQKKYFAKPLKDAALDNPIERCVMEILAENYRLKAIEHAVWHLLDDSESNGAIVTIDLAISGGAHYKRLTELLPEEHPAPVNSVIF